MSEPFAGWRDLFGGFYFVLPSHLLEGKNRNKVMKDGYAFSGGPWKLDGGKSGWKKGESITLVPNDAYWGTKPTIQKAIFQFIAESAAELQAVKTGQVDAAYPLPIDGAVDQVEESPNLSHVISFGNTFEAFWLNADKFPLDSQAVRQAIVYATDRQAIVDQVLRPAINEGRVLQSFIVPTFRNFFEPTFEQYAPDLAMVDQLMTGDGWEKNGDGIWEKGGKTASFEINSTTGNESRELTEQLWQSQLEQAGFELEIKNLNADVLFGDRLPKGQLPRRLFASVGTPDPGLCLHLLLEEHPVEEERVLGIRTARARATPTIDETWSAVDTTLDDAARITPRRRARSHSPTTSRRIPLFQTPTMFIYDNTRLGGRLQDNSVMGPFFTMNEWS